MEVCCPVCSNDLRLSPEHLGKQVRCPKCSKTFQTFWEAIPCKLEAGWFGKQRSSYKCPSCDEKLLSGEAEFGAETNCPNCNLGFIAPGLKELQELRSKREDVKRQKLERRQRFEAEKREQERRRLESKTISQNQTSKAEATEPTPGSADEGCSLFEYHNEFLEWKDGRFSLREDLTPGEFRLVIKSLRLFKKEIEFKKKDLANQIQNVRNRFSDAKPSAHKIRHKGILPFLLNIAIDCTRQSHENAKRAEIAKLEGLRRQCDEILFGCDKVIYEIERLIRSAE